MTKQKMIKNLKPLILKNKMKIKETGIMTQRKTLQQIKIHKEET